VGELAPHPLMHAFGGLCQANPGQREIITRYFPMLEAVGLHSSRYVEEELWLDAVDVGRLIEEFRKAAPHLQTGGGSLPGWTVRQPMMLGVALNGEKTSTGGWIRSKRSSGRRPLPVVQFA